AVLSGLGTNPTYGSLVAPSELGSGGASRGSSYPGGDGGGRIKITAINVAADGPITANGAIGNGNVSGSGSGGSINIVTSSLSVTGDISASGGGYQLGAGGGRIAIFHIDLETKDTSKIKALGGVGSSGSGGNGTVFLKALGES